ncbi:MAG: acetyl-CoA synthetase, partial [Succiniclasticum sp.]
NKPFVMICQGGGECHDAIMRLRDNGIPAYATAEQAVNALIALRQYGKKVAKK